MFLGKHKSLVNFWTSSCKPKPSKNEVLLPQNEGGGVIHDHFQSQTFVLQKICVQFRFKKVNFRSARSPSISVDTGIGVVATYIITSYLLSFKQSWSKYFKEFYVCI